MVRLDGRGARRVPAGQRPGAAAWSPRRAARAARWQSEAAASGCLRPRQSSCA